MTRLSLITFVWFFASALILAPAFSAPPEADRGDARVSTTTNPLEMKIARTNAADEPTRTKQSSEGAGPGTSIVQTVLGLAFVLCLILIVAAWAKRHLPEANRALPSEAVQVLGQRPIGQRQIVQLIRCGSRILILGSTPNGLTTLSEVTDPVEVDYLAGLCRQDQPNSVTSAFSRLFQNYRELGGKSTTSESKSKSFASKLRWSEENENASEAPPPETAAETPERSLKERLGRLGQSGNASRFSPPGAEGAYE